MQHIHGQLLRHQRKHLEVNGYRRLVVRRSTSQNSCRSTRNPAMRWSRLHVGHVFPLQSPTICFETASFQEKTQKLTHNKEVMNWVKKNVATLERHWMLELAHQANARTGPHLVFLSKMPLLLHQKTLRILQALSENWRVFLRSSSQTFHHEEQERCGDISGQEFSEHGLIKEYKQGVTNMLVPTYDGQDDHGEFW